MASNASACDRRTVLKATGSALGVLAGAGVASADSVDPSVVTHDATNVTSDSATLNGELFDLGGASSARVYFRWTPAGGEQYTTTDAQTVYSPGTFSETLTGLASGKTYVFEAVVIASDGDGDLGGQKSFTTDEDGGSVY